MKLQIKELVKKDYNKVIQYPIKGMHFNMYLDNKIALNLYGRYFWYLELTNVTQAISAYIGGIIMEEKQVLLNYIDKIHTTKMGVDRIKRNLKLDINNVIEYCKNKVLDKNCNIYKQGKNWYCESDDIVITINSYSYTIITAHIKK